MYSRGRKQIFTDAVEITKENICDVIQKAMSVHVGNVNDMEYLANYDKGLQPILSREKDIRPEINIKVVENHAHEIVAFKDGYEFGSPITYVQRAMVETPHSDSDTDNTGIAKMNEMLFNECKMVKDQELGNTLHIKGVAYRGVFPSKNPFSCFSIINLPPENTFVVRSNDIYQRVVLGVSYRVNVDENKAVYGAYTDDCYYELEGDINGLGLQVTKMSVNGIGAIPIVEYINDYARMGAFERVLPLLDAINVCTSDRMNGLAQFIQSLIWFNNVDIDEEQFEQLSDKGGIKTKSVDGLDAQIQMIETALNQTEVQTLADYLYEQVLQITGVPGRKQSTGGNTGQALMLGGSGWQMAETSAKMSEQLFTMGEREIINLIVKCMNKSNIEGVEEIKPTDIDIKYSRNKVSNLLTKTQGLLNQLNAGVHPQVAIANCDLYSDPQQVYIDSQEYLEKWRPQKEEDVKQVKPTNTDESQGEEQSQVQPLD